MSTDMLKEIFRLQEQFDRAVAEHRNLEYRRDVWIQMEVLAIISELSEILDEVNFKWWKDPKAIDDERLKEEIVDVLHFFVSMCLKAGIGPEAYLPISQEPENLARRGKRSEGYAGKQ